MSDEHTQRQTDRDGDRKREGDAEMYREKKSFKQKEQNNYYVGVEISLTSSRQTIAGLRLYQPRGPRHR